MPLTRECPSCDTGYHTPDHAGDPSRREYACETCHGTCEVVERCEAAGCQRDAVEYVQGVALCGICAVVEKVLYVGEDA